MIKFYVDFEGFCFMWRILHVNVFTMPNIDNFNN